MALSVPFWAWMKQARSKPKTLRERIKYTGSYLIFVIYPLLLMGLGLKYFFQIGFGGLWELIENAFNSFIRG